MPKPCYHFKFILFVTGRGEEAHLPKLFSEISKSGICSFEVGRFLAQRRPISSTKRIARMAGSGKTIPDKDFEEIGFPARRYINDDDCNRVMLVDDLEEISRNEAGAKFDRYRKALDSALQGKKKRASVHFLVNMLEAYFYAHPEAVNTALKLEPPLAEFDGDVESIRHPKNQLKQVAPAYEEIDSAGQILDLLELDIVLSNPSHCSSLRTCIKWIVDQLRAYPEPEYFDSLSFDERFHLKTGVLFDVAASQ